jgi:Spy/CpxP family protein refolding chaperone
MQPTRSKLFGVLALAGLASFVTPALAGPGHGPGGPGGPGARLEKHLKTLGLDANQQQKVQAILDAAKPQRDQIRTQMRSAFEDMHALLDQDTPDQAAVLAQADKIGQLSTEAHKEMLKTLLAVRAELTPDQRAKLKAEMMKHGPGRWRHHRGGEEGAGGAPPEPPPED